jgi:hypothetical protein
MLKKVTGRDNIYQVSSGSYSRNYVIIFEIRENGPGIGQNTSNWVVDERRREYWILIKHGCRT